MELQKIEQIKLIPAVVETNIELVSESLDVILENYKGLIFTEETAKDCKDTIAELNKGKKSLDTFRKNVKAELSKDITRFESEVKELSKKFDNVIDPLKEQYDNFETKRKEEKSERIQIFINEKIKEFELSEKYAIELTILDEYLNKTATDKKIKEDLNSRANNLKSVQDKELADIEIIKTKVELANAKFNTNLVPETYISLLKYEDVLDISEKIFLDAENTIKVVEEKEDEPVIEIPTKAIINTITEEKVFEVYKITATEKQLEELEKYMNLRGIKWEIQE